MAKGVQDYLRVLDQTLPEVCSISDLVSARIFNSRQAAYSVRKKGMFPDYFKIPGRGICFAKQSVLDWLKSQLHEINADQEEV
jgi:predicted DNA-binding transcriptional regulator AlpA